MSRLHDAARAEARGIGVSVILSAALRRRLPGSVDGPQRYTLAAGATLADLLAAVGLDPAADLTAAVDGELAEPTTPLRDGAEVMLLAAMEGGAAAEGEATIRKALKGSQQQTQSAANAVSSKRSQQQTSAAEPPKPLTEARMKWLN